MEPRKLKIKILREGAELRMPAHKGDAGYDVIIHSEFLIPSRGRVKVPLGLSLEFDSDLVCIVESKSGIAANSGLLTMGNVIDSTYRGEIHCIFYNTTDSDVLLVQGSKVCQLVFREYFVPEIEIVDELSETTRGEGGFGSTGLK